MELFLYSKLNCFVYTHLKVKTVLSQTIQFSTQFKCQKQFWFQTILFSMSTQFSSIWPINRILFGATTPGQSGPGSDGNNGVLRIPQNSSFTETSPSDCLVSYAGH